MSTTIIPDPVDRIIKKRKGNPLDPGGKRHRSSTPPVDPSNPPVSLHKCDKRTLVKSIIPIQPNPDKKYELSASEWNDVPLNIRQYVYAIRHIGPDRLMSRLGMSERDARNLWDWARSDRYISTFSVIGQTPPPGLQYELNARAHGSLLGLWSNIRRLWQSTAQAYHLVDDTLSVAEGSVNEIVRQVAEGTEQENPSTLHGIWDQVFNEIKSDPSVLVRWVTGQQELPDLARASVDVGKSAAEGIMQVFGIFNVIAQTGLSLLDDINKVLFDREIVRCTQYAKLFANVNQAQIRS